MTAEWVPKGQIASATARFVTEDSLESGEPTKALQLAFICCIQIRDTRISYLTHSIGAIRSAFADQ